MKAKKSFTVSQLHFANLLKDSGLYKIGKKNYLFVGVAYMEVDAYYKKPYYIFTDGKTEVVFTSEIECEYINAEAYEISRLNNFF